MVIDILVALVVLLFIVLGLFQGMILQIFKLAGLVLAFIFAGTLGMVIGEFLGRLFDTNSPVSFVIGSITAFLLIYILFWIVGYLINRAVTAKSEPARKINRKLGATLGLLKGIIIALFILFFIDRVPEKMYADNPGFKDAKETSILVYWAGKINPLASFEEMKKQVFPESFERPVSSTGGMNLEEDSATTDSAAQEE